MVIYCCVPGCKAQSGKGVKMHRFPKNDKMHKLWINAIQNPLLCEKDKTSIRKTYRVCHTHFGDDQQIEHGRRGACLKLNAVPTLILSRIVLGLISSCGPMAVDDTALPCQQAASSNETPSTRISPVIHKKSVPVGQKKIEDESKVEILSLAPFTPNPKIVFDDVDIGTTQTRKLLIKNPTGHDINLFIKKPIPEEINLVLSWSEAKIQQGNELLLELLWTPITEEACRHSLILSDGKRINRDVAVTFRSLAHKQFKTGIKSKSKQTKSPVKLSLPRKTVSPTKKLKQQRKPTVQFSTTKKNSPMKHCSPPLKCQKQQFQYSVTKGYSARKEQQSFVEKFNFQKKLPSKENKENMSPSYQQLLCNASASFTSPSNATFLMEVKDEERRDTFILNPISKRRETYTLQIDKRINFIETKSSVIETADTFTIESLQDSSNFSDSLESPSRTVALREQNNKCDITATLGSTHNNRDTIVTRKRSPNFEYKLKNLENFAFSPSASPYTNATPKLFLPTVCSTSIRPLSQNNSSENIGMLATELFPPANQSFQLNGSNETFTRTNTSSNTYTKGNSSFETYIVENMSTGTYVQDYSIGDLELLEQSPVSSKHQNLSPLSLKQKSSEFVPVSETNKNVNDNRTRNLSSIAEESCVFSESSLRIGFKRKTSDLNSYPSKRGKISPKSNKNWSKKGGAAYKISKATTGLSLEKFVTKSDTLQPLLTVKETNIKSVIIQNPFLYANIFDPFMTSQIYCNDEWIDQQEMHFKKLLNALLTPPTELNSYTEVDVALVWQECKKKEISEAPTKEVLSFNYHTKTKLDYLRKQAQNFFRSKEISDILQKVCIVVETGKLTIREDKDLHLNLKLKSDMISLIMSYNPLWLRIGLETIYNEIIPLKSNSDIHGLGNFILERFLKDPHLIKKHKTPYSPKYSSDLKKFLLKKFLILVYFLDRAKNAKLIQHDPCLFCKNATEKESKLVLTRFARETLSAVGDITKYLKCLGYVVTHVQSYIHEFDYAVKNLGIDLRDGVRLARVMEIIQMRSDLTSKLRVPAISRLQKVYNMQLVFKSLHESGYEIQYDISSKDIVDGHKEKTLSFLWQIIYKFEAPLLVTSATTIQTWFRSMPIMLKRRKLNRIYQKRKNAAKRIQQWYKRQKLSRSYFKLAILLKNFIQEVKQELAAIKIQNFFKMVVCRKKYLIQLSAITKLQTYARGWLIRHNYRRRIIAAKMIQKKWRGYLCRKKITELRSAVIFIQRKFRANREIRKKKLAYDNLKIATVNIQRRYRGKVAMRKCRKEFIDLKVAVIKIQSFYKMCTQRRQFLQLLNYTIIIQTKYRAQVAMRIERSNYLILRNSAVIIQQQFRAYLKMSKCRKLFLRQKDVSVKIQSFYRMYTIRKYFLQLRSAIKVIQTRYRANVIMRVQKLNYMTAKNATLFVQQRFRANLKMKKCREEFLKFKSATMRIQSIYRGYKCQEKYLKIQKATKVLQERYRAQKAMREKYFEYQALKRTVLCAQRKFRANQLKKKAVLRYIHIRQSTIIIQSYYKMFAARKRFLQLKNATLRIQRMYRSQRAMREQKVTYQKLRNSTILLQQSWRTRQLYLKEHHNFLELKKAVVTIQQRFKANKQMQTDRGRYFKVRSGTVKIQMWYRSILCMKVCRNYYLSMKKYVSVIEEKYLALKLMRVDSKRYEKLKQATVLIQQRYRAKTQMKVDRNYYLDLKSATVAVQGWYRTKELQSRYKKLKKVTAYVQAKFRGIRAMKYQRFTFITQRNAAIRIQQWYRATIKMKHCRNYYESVKLAVKNSKARYKAKKLMERERRYYENLRKSSVAIQRRYRAITIMRKLRNIFLDLQNAATVIQRRYRARRVAKIERVKYQELKKATICLQRRYRALKSMQQTRARWIALKWSAISIQHYYRAQKQMVKTRNNYNRIRNASVTIQKWYRAQNLMVKHRQQYQKLRRVIIFIQQKLKANILAKRQRAQYLKLRKSVLIVQQQFRAQMLMKAKKSDYIRLKEVIVMVQRTYRAKILMRKVREEFMVLRRTTMIIQRRYRATKAMIRQNSYYKKLKEAVVFVQQKFRASKLTKMHRTNYLKLRNAAIVIQQRYRTKKSIISHVEQYSRIKWAVLVIQRRYRAQEAMRKEMLKYRQLRHATFIIQRRFRAKVLGITMRQWFLKFKHSIRIIQEHYRAYLLMKKEREQFLKKYKAAVQLQRLARGYLVRKKYSPLLTSEAVEARTLLKIQTIAAVKIQATWRGYSVRKSNNQVIIALRKIRKQKLSEPRSSVPPRTLAQRCEMAMLCMTSENSSLLMVIRALEDLDFITRHCRNSCIRLSLILPNQLYIIISSAARSLPEMSACNMAAFILINFCKYPQTRDNSWNPQYVDAVINVLLNWCDKEAPLFATLCTLLWLFCHEKKWKQVIINLPNIKQRFTKILTLVHRKQNMVLKSKKNSIASVFGPVVNMKMPTRNANWGLDYNRPNTFTSAVFAITSLMNILNI